MVRTHSIRAGFYLGTAGLAMAAALAMPQAAHAQAFNATPVVVPGQGSATFDRTTPGQETITVTSQTVVIDWTPQQDNAGNALTFLPAGNTALFQDAPGQGGFAALNRILPSTNNNVVVFDGTVISRLQDSAGNLTPGGFVAFYSPTGILVGSNAVFDVGSLLLTSLAPDLPSFNAFATGGGTLSLIGSPGQTAGVDIQPGASISALAEGSFFAVAAPQVTMGGTAFVNGSTAYVAGEQVNLTYSNGLFDIVVPVGSSLSNPIIHTGSTGGPATTGAGDEHVIYAVAKGQSPITLLLSGNLGFQPAATAGVDNGDVILSAGSDVSGRAILPDSGAPGSIIIDNAQITSSVLAKASDTFSIITSTGSVSIADGLQVFGDALTTLDAFGGFDITIGGDVTLTADQQIIGTETVSGDIFLSASGGSTLRIDGNLLADSQVSQEVGTDSQAGTIGLIASGGTLSVGGGTTLYANANGVMAGASGSAQGGSISISADNNGSALFGGEVIGQTTAFGPGGATAGDFTVFAGSGGLIDIGDRLLMQPIATGGTNTAGIGGAGTGGSANVIVDGGTINVATTLTAFVRGTGGNGNSGGAGQGGTANISSFGAGGTISAGSIDIFAEGVGGTATGNGDGGIGSGGQAFVTSNGASGGVDVIGNVGIRSHGTGGAADVLGTGGTGNGGGARITSNNGSVSIGGTVTTLAIGTGGVGGTGGNGFGGIAGVIAEDFSGSGTSGNITIAGNVDSRTQGIGGDAIGFGGRGGDGRGGNSFVQATGSATQTGSVAITGGVTVDSSAFGGAGGAGNVGAGILPGRGGDGFGGEFGTPNQADPNFGSGAFILAGRDLGSISIGGTASAISTGNGGSGGVGDTGQTGGDGGTGTGGLAQVGLATLGGSGTINQGNLTIGDLSVTAFGSGGNGGISAVTGAAGGTGGLGTGGFALLGVVGGSASLGNVWTNAFGFGGDGDVGGTGQGGDAATLVRTGGTVTAAVIHNRGSGQAGIGNAGTGGAGSGGLAVIEVTDSQLSITGADEALLATTFGFGGTGTAGSGAGQGGTTQFLVNGASTVVAPVVVSISSSAESTSTSGPSAGATGGTTTIDISGGTVNLGVLRALSQSIGNGSNTAGQVTLIVNGGLLTANSFELLAAGAQASGPSSISALGGSFLVSNLFDVTVAGDILIETANGNIIGGPSVSAPTAIITVDAGGTITIDGDNVDDVDGPIGFGGQSMSLISTELDILTGARIGAFDVNLQARNTGNVTVIGGDTEEAGYTLTQAEAGRIEAGFVNFTAPIDPGDGTPVEDNVLIRDLTIIGSAGDGVSGVSLETTGDIRIDGILAYIDAGPEDYLYLGAGGDGSGDGRLSIVTPGGVAIVGPDGNPTGFLELESNAIWVADAETIDLLLDNPNFEGRNERLATAAAGSDDPLGYVRGGRVEMDAAQILVRNTGTAAEPGGILVGEGGLEFDFDGSPLGVPSLVDLFAYGRKQNADGSFVLGQDFFAQVEFFDEPDPEFPEEGVSYTELSSFNDCLVNGESCGGEPSPPSDPVTEEIAAINSPATITAPVSIAPVEASEDEADVAFGESFPGFVDTPLLSADLLVDDPVASGGDAALFALTGEDDDENDDEDDEDEENDEDEDDDDDDDEDVEGEENDNAE